MVNLKSDVNVQEPIEAFSTLHPPESPTASETLGCQYACVSRLGFAGPSGSDAVATYWPEFTLFHLREKARLKNQLAQYQVNILLARGGRSLLISCASPKITTTLR
jgi:hypothetical protein